MALNLCGKCDADANGSKTTKFDIKIAKLIHAAKVNFPELACTFLSQILSTQKQDTAVLDYR